MNKNTINKLAQNPHYSMNEDELEQLANLLREEAEQEAQETQERMSAEEFAEMQSVEEKPVKKVNKNRVKKQRTQVKKTGGLEETDGDSR